MQIPKGNPFFRVPQTLTTDDLASIQAGWDQVVQFIVDTLTPLVCNYYHELRKRNLPAEVIMNLLLSMQEAWLAQFFVEGYLPDVDTDMDMDEAVEP